LLVLKYKDSNPNAIHVDVAQWVNIKATFNLDINPTTVGRLLKRNDIKEHENVSNLKRSMEFIVFANPHKFGQFS